jgi:adenylate cyclase
VTGAYTLEEVARDTGLEPALIERIYATIGFNLHSLEHITEEDMQLLRYVAAVLAAGFPLVAFLQLVRVYGQAVAQLADAEVRLFHIYIHEPLMRDGVPGLEMAEEMEGLAADVLPIATPLFEYMHNRYLRFFIEQDVVGHMESEFGPDAAGLGRVLVSLCFIDLTGFTRYTEEEGDEEALDLVERFVDTAQATLPPEAAIVKTIGDEVMIVSPEPATLTEWAVGFLSLFEERPQPRVGLHHGEAVYRDGDYFGAAVNLAHRVVTRALGGEVLATDRVIEAIEESEHLEFEAIGEVELKGFPEPTPLFVVRRAVDVSTDEQVLAPE